MLLMPEPSSFEPPEELKSQYNSSSLARIIAKYGGRPQRPSLPFLIHLSDGPLVAVALHLPVLMLAITIRLPEGPGFRV